MRKKILSLVLCLILVCTSFAACGKKDEGAANNNNAAGNTETVKPEEMVTAKMQEFADVVTSALKQAEQTQQTTEAVMNGFGGEVNLEVALGESIAEAYGLSGLEKIGLLLDGDFKEAVDMDAAIALNGAELIELDIRANDEAVYVNLPKYSDNYMMVSMEDILGMSMEQYMADMQEEMAKAYEGMPTVSDFLEIWEEYSKRVIKSTTYDKCQKDANVGTGDYAFKADKYINVIEPDDLEKIMNDLANDLKEFSAFNTTVTQVELDDEDKLYLNYYEGEDGNYAWEMTAAEESMVVVVTEKGFCVYVQEAEKEPVVVCYLEKESETAGKFVITGGEESDDIEIEYKNYSENGIDFEMDVEGMKITASIQKKDGLTKVEFGLDGLGINVSGNLESAEKEAELSLSASYQGVEIGTITMTCKSRDYKEVQMPTNVVDQVAWSEGLDVEALMTDVQQMMTDYPFLMDLFMNADSLIPGGSGEDIEDDSDDDASGKAPDGYSDEFMSFTGYEIDKDGYVDFYPLEEEVLAVGKASTGFDSMAVTDTQRANLIDYAAELFDAVYPSETIYYSIFGNTEYDSVDSYYQEDYTYYDENEFSNNVSVTFDAVSGGLARIAVRNVSQEEAVKIANDMLELININFTVTAENMEEYNTVGDVVISGYAGEDSYTVNIAVYKD